MVQNIRSNLSAQINGTGRCKISDQIYQLKSTAPDGAKYQIKIIRSNQRHRTVQNIRSNLSAQINSTGTQK
jgi:hypothetical protein